ncbi:hypothetical protein FGO68_gene277 [Halteria grandinella]|uniref:Uncharacterized protein n=1 Tax=Halteria grandinella TaxID=5974 RepID=A0A8J8NHG1_HALGN|nr:hypothetical protein FGO68_gene277 [Halteria grandinella]
MKKELFLQQDVIQISKVWKFSQGKMQMLSKLTGHTSYVNCIVFSISWNWFATGSADHSIISWKEQTNSQISTQPIKKHTSEVIGLIMMQLENY